ncbi:NADH-quinone oxidoreductase subunit H [Sorangium sp. So ce302]|uniref:respiratory chain complex I subunit 1 family protein n=1 Tax=unclassified Sorangium TaxID=2621164 RepID=UPI003F61E34E
MMIARLANVAALVVMPFVLTGVINRVKSLWSGRKGPPVLQLAHDVRRLFRKSSVYSTTTTPLFRIAPYVFLATAVGSALIAPLLGSTPLASFQLDFVWFAYVWGLGRVAVMLAALDTGSSFEGMGAAREAVFSSLLEPALFLVTGALSFVGGRRTLHEALAPHLHAGAPALVWGAAVVAMLIVLQVETARMPVDDPTTHLELTMVHEVMILDHSGPDLACIHLGSAIKLFVGASIVATLLNPWAGSGGAACATANLALTLAAGVVIGTIESLVARLKLRSVPQYIVVALAAGVVALLATVWRVGGPE